MSTVSGFGESLLQKGFQNDEAFNAHCSTLVQKWDSLDKEKQDNALQHIEKAISSIHFTDDSWESCSLKFSTFVLLQCGNKNVTKPDDFLLYLHRIQIAAKRLFVTFPACYQIVRVRRSDRDNCIFGPKLSQEGIEGLFSKGQMFVDLREMEARSQAVAQLFEDCIAKGAEAITTDDLPFLSTHFTSFLEEALRVKSKEIQGIVLYLFSQVLISQGKVHLGARDHARWLRKHIAEESRFQPPVALLKMRGAYEEHESEIISDTHRVEEELCRFKANCLTSDGFFDKVQKIKGAWPRELVLYAVASIQALRGETIHNDAGQAINGADDFFTKIPKKILKDPMAEPILNAIIRAPFEQELRLEESAPDDYAFMTEKKLVITPFLTDAGNTYTFTSWTKDQIFNLLSRTVTLGLEEYFSELVVYADIRRFGTTLETMDGLKRALEVYPQLALKPITFVMHSGIGDLIAFAEVKNAWESWLKTNNRDVAENEIQNAYLTHILPLHTATRMEIIDCVAMTPVIRTYLDRC